MSAFYTGYRTLVILVLSTHASPGFGFIITVGQVLIARIYCEVVFERM